MADEYEWDLAKAQANLQKHGIDFADAIAVFKDENALDATDNSSDEERFITIGLDLIGRILLVIYTFRSDKVRIISARKATVHEQKQYKENLT